VSAAEVMEAHLMAVGRLNPQLNAIVAVAEDAREQAAAYDPALAHGNRIGPLHGVPFTVNLEILRRYLPDASVDLVYLDPPFNSNRDDNVIFRDRSSNGSDAQLLAFEDTSRRFPSAGTGR
jgi:hypothetical protein